MIALVPSRGIQSALEPAGAHADRIGDLWNLFLGITAVVYVVVMIALIIALVRRRYVAGEAPRAPPSP